MDAEKMFSSLILLILFFPFCTSTDTLKPNQSIKNGQSLMSKEKNFALGFFNPGNSSHWYLGIWYVKVTVQTVVWVANRNNPINGSSGVLSINQFGNLVLRDGYNRLLWTTNVSVQGTSTSTVAQLQDSGNLVLVRDNDKNVLWQSFDNHTDTLLPVKDMKVGMNRRTGMNWFLTSWKSEDDPGDGDYIYKLNPADSRQFFLYKGSTSTPLWRTGPWPWVIATEKTASDYEANFVSNQEVSYSYFLDDPSVITRLVVHNSGLLQQLFWDDSDRQWKELWSAPKYRCDKYGQCGANSICSPDNMNRFECTCLPGYEPKSPRDWSLRNGSEGCVRKQLGLSMCGNGEGFVNVGRVKIPDSPNPSQLDTSMSDEECKKGCLRNCSCTAFLSLNIDRKGIGCWTWYGELVDIAGYTSEGFDLKVRVDASELAKNTKKSKASLGKKGERAIAIPSAAVALFLLYLLAYMWLMKKRKAKGSLEANELGDGSRHPDLLLFDLRCMVEATDNFSPTNKLGQGGFGSVFKGQFSNGQQIAVKRLSKSSGQGTEEFKNEVMLIAKLQHRNLVKILGCCIEGEEKMLIYEYMPDKSLDFFVFDDRRNSSLNWSRRFEIIIGIARGILYLHQDSRLRIIHRDLKTTNVLLDAEMNSKISNFGVARIFKGDQIQDKTSRVVGTYGYMPPEYAVFGRFSTKSDVFSFGVIVLEIVTGTKNSSSYREHPSQTLIGHVWELWREDRALDIVDSSINESYVSHEVLRCIQVGLLCVQEDAMDRPTMSAALLMLISEATTLPSPKQPAFIFRRPSNDLDSVVGGGTYSINEVTITNFEAR